MRKEMPRQEPRLAEREETDRVIKQALELLEARRNAIAVNMDDFIDVPGYGRERVERDKARAKKKIEEIKAVGTQPTERARFLESLLIDQIELSDWFGKQSYTVAPAEYDDLYNGVDLTVGIRPEENEAARHIAMGVDVTSSTLGIPKKLAEIKRRIRAGQLTAMEYFHSEEYDPNFYGTMNNIPYVAIGAGEKTTSELAELWMSAYGLSRKRSAEADNSLSTEAKRGLQKRAQGAIEKLAKHRVSFLLLEETRIQLETFHKFAEQVGQRRIAETLASTLNSINSILRTKKEIGPEDEFENENDPILTTIKDALANFEKL